MSNMTVKLHLKHLALILFVEVLQVCNPADIQSMKVNIGTYFSEPRHHDTNKDYKLKARQFIHDEFKHSGLDTEYQQFYENTKYHGVTFANVIGVLKGERFGQADDRILGVSAHYDTVPNSPGVDDNGSGVAAMLEVVRQVMEVNSQGTKRQNTIMFISFDAEELQHLGSQSFTKQWIGPYLVRNYKEGARKLKAHGVIVMDTMMNFDSQKKSQVLPGKNQTMTYFPEALANIAKDDFEGDFLLLAYRKPTHDSDLADSFIESWNKAGQDKFDIQSFPLPEENVTVLGQDAVLDELMRSDHVALWRDNIPAIFISDSANLRGKMVQCHHQACDNMQNMLTENNLEFLSKTADVITATMNELSEISDVSAARDVGSGYLLLQFTSLYITIQNTHYFNFDFSAS